MQTEIRQLTAAEDEARRTEAWRWLLADGRGRMLLRRILNFAVLRGEAPEGPDARAYHDGRQSLGIMLSNEVETLDPEGWDLFEREARQERQLARGIAKRLEAQRLADLGPPPESTP